MNYISYRPYEVAWDNKAKTVVLHSYYARATLDNLPRLAAESNQLLSTVDYPVHVIIDRSKAPLFMVTPAQFELLARLVPPNQGQVIFIGSNYMQKTVHRVGQQIAPQAFVDNLYVDTLDEARQLLRSEFDVIYP